MRDDAVVHVVSCLGTPTVWLGDAIPTRSGREPETGEPNSENGEEDDGELCTIDEISGAAPWICRRCAS